MKAIEQTPEFQAQVRAYKQQFIQAEQREYKVYAFKGVVKTAAFGAWLGLAACIGWLLA